MLRLRPSKRRDLQQGSQTHDVADPSRRELPPFSAISCRQSVGWIDRRVILRRRIAAGAFGQEGVERVLEILCTETRVAMQQCGVAAVGELNPGFVRRAS
jgi:hypothetical protein